MLKVGLTGGIGSGKSTAVDAFRVLGVPIIDADRIAKDSVRKGQPALAEIVNVFGLELLFSSGELNREKLKQLVFSDPKSLTALEAILHPHIKATILQQIKSVEHSDKIPAYVVVDIPLLIEKNYQTIFDEVIVVDCSSEQQINRVIKRDNLDLASIENIMQIQLNRKKRKQVASHVLDNSKTIDYLIEQVNQLHQYFVSKK